MGQIYLHVVVIMSNSNFRDSLAYCKLAMEIFLLSTVIIAIGHISMLAYLGQPGPSPPTTPGPSLDSTTPFTSHITPMDIRNSILFPSIPLIGAILTHFKLTKPLELGRKPSKAIFVALTILGYFAGLIIAGILLSLAYKKLPKQL